MTTYVFDQVTRSASKRVKCAGCGKSIRRTRTFWQTLNPFNKNPDGTVRTERDIYDALGEQIAAWDQQTERHAKCEAPRD
jgi:hypothetical protein